MKEVLLETWEWIFKNVWTCPFKVIGYDFFFYYAFRWLLDWPESNQPLFYIIGITQSFFFMVLLAYLCIRQTKRFIGQMGKKVLVHLLYSVCTLFYLARLYILVRTMMA